jgi:hypothetical protein
VLHRQLRILSSIRKGLAKKYSKAANSTMFKAMPAKAAALLLPLTKATAQITAPEANATGDNPITNSMSLSTRIMELIVLLASDTNISKAMVHTV